MKHTALLALSTLALCACSDQSGTSTKAAKQDAQPAKVAQEATPAATQPAAAVQPGATTQPAGSGQAAAAVASTPTVASSQAQAGAEKAKLKPSSDPANARGSARYQGGIDKLESEHDVTKVKVDETAAAADPHAGHDHDHSHAEPGSEIKPPNPQDGSALLPAAQAEANKGRFSLVEGATQVQDLGKLRQGDVGSFEFPFVSDGEEALVITGVKPSCGCTKAEIMLLAEDGTKKTYTKGDPIPVGQKYVLESEINTDGRQGAFSAQVTLYGNDIRGAFNVRLTAEIEPVLSILPSPTVFFGKITSKDRVEQTINVKATRGESFLLTLGQDAAPEPVAYEIHAKEPDADGKAQEWEIKVALGPNSEIGMRNYPLKFNSDIPITNPKYPSQDGKPQMHGFVVNVQAQVQGMVSTEPSFITFGMVRPGEPVERKLRIDSHDDFKLTADIPVAVEGLQGQEFPYKDAFETEITPIEDGKAADLKVRLTGLPADLNGSLGGVLRIKVGHPYMPDLSIRFSAVCRPLPPTTPPAQPQGQGAGDLGQKPGGQQQE